MKIYLAAENKDMGIRLANIINRSGGTCIMSDFDSGGYRALLKDIRNSMAGFDLSILISGSPQEAGMDANRIGGIRAAVCKDLEDVSAAVAAKANLIVLDAGKLSRIDGREMVNIFQENLGAVTAQDTKPNYSQNQPYRQQAPTQQLQKKQGTIQIKQPEQQRKGPGLKGIFGIGRTNAGLPPKFNIKKPEIKVKQPAQEPQKPQKKRGGLFGSLKDTFGVE